MANHYFRFKQFTIYQQHCAMKVTTDACLFGALVADVFSSADYLNAIDIGAGTGLLSLMLAQKNTSAVIDAVEVDDDAAIQAKENFTASDFGERINLHHADIKEFVPGKKYDLVICNPPFYEDDLKSPDEKRNKALHDSSLLLNELIRIVKNLLAEKGTLAILLPAKRTGSFIALATGEGMYCRKNIALKQTEKHAGFRNVLFLGKEKAEMVNEEIIIKAGDEYSSHFVALLKDYYLFL